MHPDSLPLLLASGGLEIDRIARTTSLDLYLSKGGTDPLAAVLGMESVPIGQRRRYLDAFLSLGGLSREDLVGRAQDAVKSSRDSASMLAKALAAYSGTRDLDSDGTGTGMSGGRSRMEKSPGGSASRRKTAWPSTTPCSRTGKP